MTLLARQLRTLLVLGRVSNLPTVWSNCLAAWLLNGGIIAPQFFLLCVAATLLYTGGMFLNDAFDVEFDRRHRVERPIPSGQISSRNVWWLGTSFLLTGWFLLLPLGSGTTWLGLLLLAAIVIYDALHKRTALAPLIMAACRFLLYLVAAAAVGNRMAVGVVWHGLALAAYVAGLSFIARGESNQSVVSRWPLLLLLAPVAANMTVHPQQTTLSWGATVVFILWVGWCLRKSLGKSAKVAGPAVAGLLAGIVLVDWAAVASPDLGRNLIFIGLFCLALLFQRKIPAT
jgi:hypothetical protein